MNGNFFLIEKERSSGKVVSLPMGDPGAYATILLDSGSIDKAIGDVGRFWN
jgi:hypothetical protein